MIFMYKFTVNTSIAILKVKKLSNKVQIELPTLSSLQAYVRSLRTVRLKKPLQPSQLEIEKKKYTLVS